MTLPEVEERERDGAEDNGQADEDADLRADRPDDFKAMAGLLQGEVLKAGHVPWLRGE